MHLLQQESHRNNETERERETDSNGVISHASSERWMTEAERNVYSTVDEEGIYNMNRRRIIAIHDACKVKERKIEESRKGCREKCEGTNHKQDRITLDTFAALRISMGTLKTRFATRRYHHCEATLQTSGARRSTSQPL